MRVKFAARILALMSATVSGSLFAAGTDFAMPLPLEPVPQVLTLPAQYPPSWMFLHDVHFASLMDGRLALVDLAAGSSNLKAQVPASQLAGFLMSTARRELYVAETFYSRGTRGERTDVVTIHDMGTLAIKGEIVLPPGRRGLFIPLKTTFQMSGDGRYGFLFNFTPAASVTMIDLQERRAVRDIDVPGCALIYPTGARNFATLCSDGTLSTIEVSETGAVASQQQSERFNDLDRDPMFMFHAMLDGVAYSPTFLGDVRPIDLRARQARVLPAWPLGSQQEKDSGWRPSGWQVVAGDDQQRLYVLMQPDGQEGSHKQGGTEVWVYDVAGRKRVQRIALTERSTSIEVTRGDKPRLAATRGALIDVYDAATGQLERSLGAQIAHDPLVLHATR